MPSQCDFDKAFFESTFSTFQSEIYTKQLQINKIEMELIRKCEGKTEILSTHLQIIKYCRKSIDSIDDILRDIKSFFADLKIGELYQLVENVFRVLVYDVKKISECYLKRFQSVKAKEMEMEMEREAKSLGQSSKNLGAPIVVPCRCRFQQKEMARKLEHIDFEIHEIEVKESKLQDQMNFLIHDLAAQKQKVQNINSNPAAHTAIFTQIERLFAQISKKAESMFSSYYKYILQEQNKGVFLEPETFDEEVFLGLKREIKTISKNKIHKIEEIVSKIYRSKWEASLGKVKRQMERKYCGDSDRDSDCQGRDGRSRRSSFCNNKLRRMKTHRIYISEDFPGHQQLEDSKNELQKQLQTLKKANKALSVQLQELKQQNKKQSYQKIKADNEIKEYQSLLQKKSQELEQSRSELRWIVEKNTRETLMLTSKKLELEEKYNRSVAHAKSSGGASGWRRVDGNYLHSKEDKEVQTDILPYNQEASYAESFLFEHKPFFPSRSKFKKRTSNEFKEKVKSVEVEKNLKQAIGKISEFLFDRDRNQERMEQKNEMEALLKEQKYDEIITRIKSRLDHIYEISKASKEEQSIKNIANKKSKKKIKQTQTTKSSRKQTQHKYTEFGIQTSEVKKQPLLKQNQDKQKEKQKEQKNQMKNVRSSRGYENDLSRSQRSMVHKSRSKMATMMNLDSQIRTSNEGLAGLKTERSTPAKNGRQNRNSEMKEYNNNSGAGTLSRFFHYSGQYSNPDPTAENQQPQSQKSRKGSNFLENALFETLTFDGPSSKNQTKRQSIIQKFTEQKRKQSITRFNNRDSLMGSLGRDQGKVIKEREDEEVFVSSRLLDVHSKRIQSSDFIVEDPGMLAAGSGGKRNSRVALKYLDSQIIRHQSQL